MGPAGQPGLEILPGKETDVATANHKDWTEVNPNEGDTTSVQTFVIIQHHTVIIQLYSLYMS